MIAALTLAPLTLGCGASERDPSTAVAPDPATADTVTGEGDVSGGVKVSPDSEVSSEGEPKRTNDAESAEDRAAATGGDTGGDAEKASNEGPAERRAAGGGTSPDGSTQPKPAGATASENSPSLSPALLEESLELGRRFLLANQTEQGNFRYAFDAVSGEVFPEDNQVRQAGALWGLALIHRAEPTDETRRAVARGLAFHRRYSAAKQGAGAFIEYPRAFRGETGTVALVTLAGLEWLEADAATEQDAEQRALVRRQVEAYANFLLSLRRSDGRFHREYRWSSGAGLGLPSSYFDGETLLALVKASRVLSSEQLQPMLEQSAEAMYQAYVVEARKEDPDSDLTKGFYQWGSMAWLEMYDAGWERRDEYARRCIELAHWMIDVHRTLERRRNTGYAHEGLVCAWELARRTGDEASQRKIGAAIEQGLSKLSTWQIGGSVANDYLRGLPGTVPEAEGGVMSAADDPRLRIDTTQHQMHAVILARRYMFR